jgi:hypothetical protein
LLPLLLLLHVPAAAAVEAAESGAGAGEASAAANDKWAETRGLRTTTCTVVQTGVVLGLRQAQVRVLGRATTVISTKIDPCFGDHKRWYKQACLCMVGTCLVSSFAGE